MKLISYLILKLPWLKKSRRSFFQLNRIIKSKIKRLDKFMMNIIKTLLASEVEKEGEAGHQKSTSSPRGIHNRIEMTPLLHYE